MRASTRWILFWCLTALLWAHLAGPSAQAQGAVFRIAHLSQAPDSERLTRDYTLPELARHGFVDGQNTTFVFAHGPSEKLPDIARELVAAQPNVIVAIGATAARAAAGTTDRIPIVIFADDPIANGLTTSLNRPDRNVTGIVNLVLELSGKRLALLAEIVPNTKRAGVLLWRSAIDVKAAETVYRKTAERLGLPIVVETAASRDQYPSIFQQFQAMGIRAVAVGANPQLFADRVPLAQSALEAGIALACEWAEMARAGCLLGYGADQKVLRVRLADYVAKLLRGAKPADLAFEQPSKIELAINLRVAAALGLTVPQALLVLADETIE